MPAAASSDEEARARLERFGANELLSEPGIPGWRRFLAQFEDVLVILLLVATAISAVLWLYERDTALPFEAIAISAIVLLNAVIGYVQEARAETAIAALRQMSAERAHVIRDGDLRTTSRLRVGARRHPESKRATSFLPTPVSSSCPACRRPRRR